MLGEMTARTIAYGSDPSQRGDLHLPDRDGPLPVVIVVHGGFWRSKYGYALGTPLAEDLIGHGVAAWNIEYRRVGGGGGWPETLLDVAAAVDALADPGVLEVADLDLGRVSVLGHSAGGQLACWIAARTKLPVGAPGADPAVMVGGAVSQAGVVDLVDGAALDLGDAAVAGFLGGVPADVPSRYATASPYELLPLGVPVTLVHGLDDVVVPVRQSDRYAAAATALGDDVQLIRLPGVDHMGVIDTTSAAWAHCRDAALRYVGL
jgi:acetyl esterase/lipase